MYLTCISSFVTKYIESAKDYDRSALDVHISFPSSCLNMSIAFTGHLL